MAVGAGDSGPSKRNRPPFSLSLVLCLACQGNKKSAVVPSSLL